jgi:hypothetical protein
MRHRERLQNRRVDDGETPIPTQAIVMEDNRQAEQARLPGEESGSRLAMPAQRWEVKIRGEVHGPFKPKALRKAAAEGRIHRRSLIRMVGQDRWMPAGKLKDLFPAPLGLVPKKPDQRTDRFGRWVEPPSFGGPDFMPHDSLFAPSQRISPFNEAS